MAKQLSNHVGAFAGTIEFRNKVADLLARPRPAEPSLVATSEPQLAKPRHTSSELDTELYAICFGRSWPL